MHRSQERDGHTAAYRLSCSEELTEWIKKETDEHVQRY